jgi:hypothetical protein
MNKELLWLPFSFFYILFFIVVSFQLHSVLPFFCSLPIYFAVGYTLYKHRQKG